MVVLLLLLGALALWGASGLTWVTEAVERTGTDVARSGTEIAPELVPLAVLAAAAIAAVVALSGWVRRVLGGVVLAAGLGAGWVVVAAGGGLAPRALALVGALLVLAAGVLLLVKGPSMPRLGGSYQTPGAAKRTKDPDKDMWHALERGDDPTDRD